jgi:hypothetical protein
MCSTTAAINRTKYAPDAAQYLLQMKDAGIAIMLESSMELIGNASGGRADTSITLSVGVTIRVRSDLVGKGRMELKKSGRQTGREDQERFCDVVIIAWATHLSRI